MFTLFQLQRIGVVFHKLQSILSLPPLCFVQMNVCAFISTIILADSESLLLNNLFWALHKHHRAPNNIVVNVFLFWDNYPIWRRSQWCLKLFGTQSPGCYAIGESSVILLSLEGMRLEYDPMFFFYLSTNTPYSRCHYNILALKCFIRRYSILFRPPYKAQDF